MSESQRRMEDGTEEKERRKRKRKKKKKEKKEKKYKFTWSMSSFEDSLSLTWRRWGFINWLCTST